MKDVRITFRAEDFAAVSKSMIDLGVRFQVEPMEPRGDEAVASGGRSAGASGSPGRGQGKRKPAKTGRQNPGGEGSGPVQAGIGESSAAARLRAMAERNRAAAGRAAGEGASEGYAPPADGEPT